RRPQRTQRRSSDAVQSGVAGATTSRNLKHNPGQIFFLLMGGESSMFLMGAARRGTAQPDPHTSPISVLNRWEGLWRAGAAARGECRMQTTHDYSICPYFEGK